MVFTSWEDFKAFRDTKRVEVLREALREANSGLVVLFTKKDGTRRNMRCTTNESLIPADKQPKNAVERKHSNVNNIPVFDLDANNWRSFNVDTVESVTVL